MEDSRVFTSTHVAIAVSTAFSMVGCPQLRAITEGSCDPAPCPASGSQSEGNIQGGSWQRSLGLLAGTSNKNRATSH